MSRAVGPLRVGLMAAAVVCLVPSLGSAQQGGFAPGGRPGGYPGNGGGYQAGGGGQSGYFPGGGGGYYPGGGGGGGMFGGGMGLGQRARMIPDRASQYTSITGSGVLRTSLPIITQFGGAGGMGTGNYAGGGVGFAGGFGGGPFGGAGNGVGGLHPPGVSLNQAYNTLVGLPTQPSMGGGFPPFGPAYGFPPGPGFGFPNPGFGYPPGPVYASPAKYGAFGNGGYGL